MPTPGRLVALACIAAPPLAAQVPLTEWRQVVPAVSGHAVAFDLARGCTVLFGGVGNSLAPVSGPPLAATWEFDGSRWQRRDTPTAPPPRTAHAMAYDVAHQNVVLFGGDDGTNVLDDTWTWDGSVWRRLAIAAPPARAQHTLVHDLWRSRCVLFGGRGSTAYLDDTWEFDGAAWTPFVGTVQPPARVAHAASFDVARGRTVVTGGFDGTGMHRDTWEFDGMAWHLIFTPAPPPAGALCATFDAARSRTVVLRGHDGWPDAELWEYDGAGWTQQVSPLGRRSDAAIAYDWQRNRTLIMGGREGTADTGAIATVWAFDGTSWTIAADSPEPRAQAAMAFDRRRGRAVLFGGLWVPALTDTWELAGSTWTRVATRTTPPSRVQHAMTWVASRGVVVMFGGLGPATWSGTVLGDTWEYDGTDWSLATTANAPPARMGHGLADDVARDRVVLFGGADFANPFADTWEYDGTDWRRVATAASPPAGAGRALAYDAARDRTVLFAGRCAQAALDDTWEYDGTTWRPVAPFPGSGCIGGVLGGALVHDVLRGRTVLWKGDRGLAQEVSTWQFDGAQWQPMTAPETWHRLDTAVVFDPEGQRLVMFGGVFGGTGVGDTLELPLPAVPTWTRHGVGCAGSAGVPVLTAGANDAPALGATFAMRLQGLPPQPGLAVVAFGTDLVRWNTVPLPVALDPFGLPGCRLHVAPEPGALRPVVHAGATATLALAIPNAASLAGMVVGAQALVLDAAAPSGLGAVTNALLLRAH